MEQVDFKQYSRRGPTRFTYEGGLKNLFAACHQPMPSKMESLLKSLENYDDRRRISEWRSRKITLTGMRCEAPQV